MRTNSMKTVAVISQKGGAGKTTLFDIMAGIIQHGHTQFNVYINNVLAEHGFEHLKESRTYLATDIRINLLKTSFCDLITSNSAEHDETLVWQSIRMSECDFVTAENLHKNDTNVSKGQSNRLKVARYMYDILVNNPTMVLLDEIADGVDPDTTTNIAENMFAYFRHNNILCLVTTHLPYLQGMKYDMQINVEKGNVRLL